MPMELQKVFKVVITEKRPGARYYSDDEDAVWCLDIHRLRDEEVAEDRDDCTVINRSASGLEATGILTVTRENPSKLAAAVKGIMRNMQERFADSPESLVFEDISKSPSGIHTGETHVHSRQ